MIKFFLYLNLLIIPRILFAQIGINTDKPHINTDLHLGSKNKAIMLNLVNDLNEIDDPQNGMLIYDLIKDCFRGYSKNTWTDCFGSYKAQQQEMAVVVADGPGFMGDYIAGETLKNNTFEVLIRNNSFSTVTINFNINDLKLDNSEIKVSGIKFKRNSNTTTLEDIPYQGITLYSDTEIVLVYQLEGKPSKSGLITGNWKKLSLNFEDKVEVIYKFDCSRGYWEMPLSPTSINGLENGVSYTGIYRIPFTNAEDQIFSAEIIRKDGLILKRDQIIGSDNGYIEYSLRGTYTGETGKFVEFTSLEKCTIIAGNLPKNCNEIKSISPNRIDGIYTIDPDGIGGVDPFPAYCDMTTDGGGWTLILNYNHKGGTNPPVSYKTISLPLLNENNLGIDESVINNQKHWGHASNELLNKFAFEHIRFYGITSAHSRIIHFKTNLKTVKDYAKTGVGTMNGIQQNFTPLIGHTAILPDKANSFFTDKKDDALIDFPFYTNGIRHWGVKGTGSPSGVRWEVDDFPANSNNDTHHQVWIR